MSEAVRAACPCGTPPGCGPARVAALALDLRPVKGVPAGTKYSDVRLLDETVLHCDKVAFRGKNAELTLLSGQQVKVPIDSVVWVLHDAGNEPVRKEWEALVGQAD